VSDAKYMRREVDELMATTDAKSRRTFPPAWLENWHVSANSVVDDEGGYVLDDMRGDGWTGKIAAAAPAMVRVLLEVEWDGMNDSLRATCPQCMTEQDWDEGKHDSDCTFDAALTLAGFPDQAARNAARERMRQGEIDQTTREEDR
jgi:hypothetical protein